MAKGKNKATEPAAVSPTLAEIVKATVDGGFLYVNKDTHAGMVGGGMIELNPAMTDANGAVAARATAQGIASMTETNTNGGAPANAETAATAATEYKIVRRPMKDIPIRKGGGRTDKYPFDKLAAPTTGTDGKLECDGFFIPATEKQPNPEKTLVSTVNAAARRHAKEVGTEEYQGKGGVTKSRKKYDYDRKFRIYAEEIDGVPGAWVERYE